MWLLEKTESPILSFVIGFYYEWGGNCEECLSHSLRDIFTVQVVFNIWAGALMITDRLSDRKGSGRATVKWRLTYAAYSSLSAVALWLTVHVIFLHQTRMREILSSIMVTLCGQNSTACKSTAMVMWWTILFIETFRKYLCTAEFSCSICKWALVC